ncbi:ABC transporter substrate-binding protein [Desulfovibrio sp. JC022]|uniref:ABC transporter substrate-binding protein n=1 Tax=Desulfovibrio sp. JC022 TaxID=2593642 RepID=UPI0013CF505D|nr:ABC transporter substrate-binding protein [Desulfovibrio sp. JC022]
MLTLLLILTSCSDTSPIKIGFVGSITGRFSELGVTARNTLQLMTDEQNKAGGINGRKIELVIRDDKSSPEEAKAAIIDLVQNNVRLILGPITSAMAQATTEAIAGRDVLVMSPTMSTDFLADKDDNLLRTATSSTGQASTLADRAISLGLGKTAIIGDMENKKYATAIANRFKSIMKKAGKEIPVEIAFLSSQNPDFTSIAEKISAKNPDSILFITNGFDAAMLSQALRKTKLKKEPFFGVSWAQSNDIITHGGRAVEGMRLIGLHDYDNVAPEIIALKKQYISRYNKEPSFIYTCYAKIFKIAVYGLEKAKSDNSAQIKHSILDKKTFHVVGTEIVFNKYGDVKEEFNILVIKNGKFVNDI